MGTQAREKTPQFLARKAIQLDAANVFFQGAFNKLTRHIKCSSVGRKAWVFYNARYGDHRPWEALTIPMQLAMDNPACTEEDAMGMVHALAGMVHAHYANCECQVTTVKEALRLSVGEGTSEIAADVNAIADPSDSNLEKVLEAKVADRRQDEAAITLIETQLAARVRR